MDEFISEWKNRGNEKSDSHQFWDAMFRTFWKILNPNELMKFEVPVQVGDSQCYIDVWIPKTRVIIEQKSRGRKLDKVEKQSDGSMLNPFGQAKRYDDHRKTSEKARWIITCNFDEFWIYNLEADRPELHVRKIKLEELPERFGELDFLVDEKQSEIKTAEYVSASAGSLVKDFYDLFRDSVSTMTPAEIVSLNKFCIRCVFCMYAEDSGIFERKSFLNYLKESRDKSLEDVKNDLANLFWRLNTKDLPKRGIDPRLLKFPYVDGELFEGESLEILDRLDGNFDFRKMIDKLIDASEKNIWSKISPTIFGSIFESIMSENTRRGGGIHYTSPENIHRVIDPLFLDELNSEFDRNENLDELHDKIAQLKFFDPACGSGNFLTETFISLRKLEDRIIAKIGGSIKVSIENFYGIEINDWAVQVAKLALWISEHQMNGGDHFLPLKRNANIIEGNSLMIDWKSVIPNADFIMGNPPYIGYSMQNPDQKSEMRSIFEGYRAAGKMDYVCAWFKKASEYIRDSKTEVGFVATNSICQGEHVGFLWKDLFEDGIKINFAWSSFKWSNESPDKKSMAQVHCVIVGFSRFDRSKKFIDGVEVNQINGYLKDAPNVCIESRKDAIDDRPNMIYGSKPTDGGNLIIEAEDLDSFVERDPRSKKFIRKLIGAEEFNDNRPRYCLWLVDAEPNEIKSIKPIYERVQACKKFRESSKKEQTRESAKTPWLFQEIRQPIDGNFIIVPAHTTKRRKYIPFGFLSHDKIVSNASLLIPNGSLEVFGILTSSVHMAWTRVVCGRLGDAYRYSAQVVYNNFPFPKPNPKIESTAQKILDARSNHPNSSLAELYDPNLMPQDLRKAHDENDRAVLDSYGFPKNISESEIVARLFEMYQSLTK
ncbi:MAG: restriction endonuclease subunit M [Selenomonadaceae bacterium]|nr:restriction endonuclease subunit M [Selenomonadaceae bacterium]